MATEKNEVTETKVEQKPKKKVIQISTAVTNTGQVLLFALADDGSIHMTRPTNDEFGWSKVKSI